MYTYIPPFGKGQGFFSWGGDNNLKLANLNTGEILAEQVTEARTFARRLKGLMFTKALPQTACLHIEPCRSVHTFFMNYAIDVLYLDRNRTIVGIESRIKPGRLGAVIKNTASVVELPGGSLEQTRTKIGQTVQFQNDKGAIDDEQN